jgi:precorrin-8X/cobalt-precorrin-8 methylmutase
LNVFEFYCIKKYILRRNSYLFLVKSAEFSLHQVLLFVYNKTEYFLVMQYSKRPVFDPASTPDTIEARSFAIIEAETGAKRPFSGDAWKVARRLVHTAGDLSLLDALVLPDEAVAAGVCALRRGTPVFTDTEMVRAGIPARRTDLLGVRVSCALSESGRSSDLGEEAQRLGTTRARAGIAALGERLGGSIVAIGNAPTAVLALVDYLDRGGSPPALVIAMPVGFVNAAESKELLLQYTDIHTLTLRGRRGGSPLAAAAVNALAAIALE